MSGYFLSIEGPDGSGKGTLIKKIIELFNQHKLPLFLTREPGSNHSEVCSEIRKLILSPFSNNEKMSDMTEMLLFAADRSHHVNSIILPNLSKNKVIICDRFVDSTVAYQGFGRFKGSPEYLKIIDTLNAYAVKGVTPDMTLCLMGDVKILHKRISKNEFGNLDRIEKESLEFHGRVVQGYHAIAEEAKKTGRNFHFINAEKTPEECFMEAKKLLIPVIKERYDINL